MTLPQRQTVTFLQRRLKEVGLQPNARHGQNFLIDMNLLDILVDAAQLSHDDVVLEIGTGTGSLTGLMAPRAAAVVTVEIDAALHQLAQEECEAWQNVTYLHQDALRNKNNLRENILETVEQKMKETGAKQFKLVANLPYNVATPIISNLLSTRITPAAMVVTIQKELADRIIASPSTKDYSALSIWIQSQCNTEIVRILSPTVFWPRPKVHSAFIRIEPDAAKRASIPDHEFFHQFVRAMFFHRRKFLRSVLIAAYKEQFDKTVIDEVMAEQQLGPDSRAEQLDVAAMLALCEAIRTRLPR